MATDWPALKLEFVNGSETLGEVAERHGLKSAAVRKRAEREGWQAARHTASHVVTQAASERLLTSRADELAKFNDDDIRLAHALKARAEELMAGNLSPNDLRALAGVMDTAQKVGRLALGASTENSSVSTRELPASVDEFV